MNNSIFTTTIQDGNFIPPAELVSPPPARPFNSRVLLWALTLVSFLGGTYYGYQFRRAAAAASEAGLVLVARDGALVAKWDSKTPGLAAIETAQLRVSSGAQQLLLPVDKSTLRRGELVLEVDPSRAAKIELVGKGIAGRARFLAGDPLDSAMIHADPASLRAQIADQQDLNRRMERLLARSR